MNRVSMVLACAAMLFAVQPAGASEEASSSDLAEMRELVNELKQKVDAQEEQIEHQGQLLEQAQDVARRQQEEGTQSGLSSFLDAIEVGGHVAGSYNYNFNTPHGVGTEANAGDPNNADFGPPYFLSFHRDHNTFTIDQVWFSIAKPATEESRAGFGFDILYGQNANFFGQGGLVNNNGDLISRRSQNFDGTSDYYVHQAYIEYQCGCLGPEINFTFGKFATLVGAEVAQAPANFNITRGNVYTFLQPVDHLGLLASSDLGPVNLSLGIVNSGTSGISSPDVDTEKSYIFSGLVGNDEMNVRTSFIYGAEGAIVGDLDGTVGTRSGLVDVTAYFTPMESLSLWANYNYLYTEGTGHYVNGVAVAGRLAITEKLGAAIRGEYIRERAAQSIANTGREGIIPILDDDDNIELYSLTGTLDYALTDHLMARAEARFDWIDSPGDAGEGFLANHDGEADNQTVGLVELVYSF